AHPRVEREGKATLGPCRDFMWEAWNASLEEVLAMQQVGMMAKRRPDAFSQAMVDKGDTHFQCMRHRYRVDIAEQLPLQVGAGLHSGYGRKRRLRGHLSTT